MDISSYPEKEQIKTESLFGLVTCSHQVKTKRFTELLSSLMVDENFGLACNVDCL